MSGAEPCTGSKTPGTPEVGEDVGEKVRGDDDVQGLRRADEPRRQRVDEDPLVPHCRELGGSLLANLVPEDVAVARGVRLGCARQHAAAPRRALERVPHHALHSSAGEDARLDRDLGRERVVGPPAHAGVLALRVLAHEEDVDVRRRLRGQRAGDSVEEPAGPKVGPQVELLPQLEDRPPERDVIRDGGISHRAQQDGVEGPEGLERVRRHHQPVLVPVGGPPRELGPGDRKLEGVHGPPGFGDHLRAHPVAGEERDAVRQAGAPTLPGTLST
jgi:hypothetical protein